MFRSLCRHHPRLRLRFSRRAGRVRRSGSCDGREHQLGYRAARERRRWKAHVAEPL